MRNLKFSGHETFIARGFWPKKGYDYINQNYQFNDPEAVVRLGVGKNMVNSIQFWTNALGIYDNTSDEFSLLADYLLDNNGFNETTVGKDIDVFRRIYNTPEYRTLNRDFEDEINGLFIELGLLTVSKESFGAGKDKVSNEWFYLTPSVRKNLPSAIVLFMILDHFEGFKNISFSKLESEPNGPGLVCLLNKDGLYKQLQDIENKYEGITISETAGNISLTITEDIDKWNVLNEYYGN